MITHMMQVISGCRAMAEELERYHGLYGSERTIDDVIESTLKSAAELEKSITEPPRKESNTTVSERFCGCTKD